ncbi:MAG TPA: hypothetical protein VMI53_02780, partial [Opitutaceae bacterium]|nr:hypothetical protein [Opitutaceae bacterium]
RATVSPTLAGGCSGASQIGCGHENRPSDSKIDLLIRKLNDAAASPIWRLDVLRNPSFFDF